MELPHLITIVKATHKATLSFLENAGITDIQDNWTPRNRRYRLPTAMADAGVDIAQLSEEQQLTLQQLIAVTEQEPKDAIPLLQRCQWNLQVCADCLYLSAAPMLIIDRLR